VRQQTHLTEQQLWGTVVACVDSHEQVLRGKGFSEERIIAAVRIAAVVHAIAVVLDTDRVAEQQLVAA